MYRQGYAVALLVVLAIAFLLGHWAGGQSAKNLPDTATIIPPVPDWARQDLPDFSNFQDVAKKKSAFFSFLYPRVVLADARVLALRQHLLQIAEKKTLSKADSDWLASQAKRLDIDAPLGSPRQIALLKRRLDIVPPSLVLAQAANESGWGSSRFARKGNNLFGQWCFDQGCGLVPKARDDGAHHEVASFSDPYQSIRSYIANLNRNPSYVALRVKRQHLRKDDKFPSGMTLALKLNNYSEKGSRYIRQIRFLIQNNDLEVYDHHFRSLLSKGLNADKLSQLAGVPAPGKDQEVYSAGPNPQG